MPTQLVILAAGIGHRFGGLKQLTPVGPSGETIMDYTVFDAAFNGFDEVVMVIRRETEADIRAHVDQGFGQHLNVRYVFQETDPGRTRPWGTVHALLAAGPSLRGPFAVANADDHYGRAAIAILGEFLTRPATSPPTWAMVGYTVSDTLPPEGAVSRGLVQADDGFLRTIEEVHDVHRDCAGIVRDTDDGPRMVSPKALVSMNLWGFGPEVLAHLEQRFAAFRSGDPGPDAECYLPEEVGAAVTDGVARVAVLPTDSRWCGMTSATDLEIVRETMATLVAEGVYPRQLWIG